MPGLVKKVLVHAENVLKNSKMRESNKKHISDFLKAANSGTLRGGKEITIDRQYKYITVLTKLDELLGKDFSEATKADIEKLVASINNIKHKGKPISDWTKYTYQVVLKRFYKWLLGDNDEYPAQVKWIHPKMERGHKISEGRLLTFEDVEKMADHTNNLRDRAFVLFLYESGARIGEVINIRIENFKPDQYGAIVTIPEGKTGSRDIRIIASAPALNLWLERGHPDRDNKDSMLFCGLWSKKKGKDIEYATFRYMLKDLAKKAGIKKPVNPHYFRHSRASDLAKKVKSPAILCQFMGWKQGSKEAATYVHLDSTDKEILAINGIKREEQKQEEFKPIKCPRCGIFDSPGSKACPHCGIPLDIQSVLEYEKTSKETLKNIDDPQKLQSMLEIMIKRIEQLEKEKYEGK
jgi:integrase